MTATEINPVEADFDNPKSPRRNPDLIGHRTGEDQLLGWYQSGRMPHAIILGGTRGIGKATLAYRLARFMLAEAESDEPGGLFGAPPPPSNLYIPPEHPVFRRVSSGGHADLLTIARAWDPKRKRLRGEIVVEDVRAIASFVHLTSGEGGWRVVVVDGADEMNRSAANALLKVLEEPPARTLILLVCHAPGRLLPTIRSRCRRLILEKLPDEDMLTLLAEHLPDQSTEQHRALAVLSDGSIGRALELARGDGVALYRAVLNTTLRLPTLDGAALQDVVERLNRAEEDEFNTVLDLFLDFLAQLAVGAAEGGARPVPLAEEADLLRLSALLPALRWLDLWEELRRFIGRSLGLNLDRRQIMIDVFARLRAATARAAP